MRAPTDVVAMAATSTDRRRFDDGWTFERKLDGYRCLATVDDAGVSLRSRNGLEYAGGLPGLAAALANAALGSLVVDGELVVVDGEGRTSFEGLQQAMSGAPEEVRLVVFDLLWFEGNDLRPLPLVERRAALDEVLRFDGAILRSDPIEGDAEELLAAACGLGWEGLIAKRAASSYQGRRSRDWLKLKCVHRQEVVVGGWTDPKGARAGLGALLVGVHDAEGLRYAGKVGTGFDDATLRSLHAELLAVEVAERPFVEAVREPGAHWVAPTLVVEVGFGEWSAAGRLRHPRYLGRRPDKDPAEVVREPG